MNLTDRRSQARTLEVARHSHAHWTTRDLEFVHTHGAERDEDIALALGRTLYAVRDIRAVLADRLERAERAARPPRLAYDRGITDLAAWEASFA